MTGFALGNVILGRFVDRLGIAMPLIGTGIFLGVGFIACALTTSIWQFTLIQGFFIGIGSSACFGPLMANISHWFKRRRGIAVALTACGTYIAGSVWPIVMKGFVQTEGWRWTYTAIGVFCIVTMIPLAMALRRKPPIDEPDFTTDSTHTFTAPITLLSPRALQSLLMIAGVACCVAMSMPQVHIVSYSVDLGYGVARGAEMLSIMLAGGVVSRIVFGFVADRIGGLRTCLLASSLQCIALFLFLPFDGLLALYLVSLIFGLSQGGIVPSYTIIVREYLPAREAGQRVGMVIMSTIFGMAIGGWLSGWIYDMTGNYDTAFVHGIAWNLVNIFILAALTWRASRARSVAYPGETE
jgi:MFS family permease